MAVDRISSVTDCKTQLELDDKKREHAEYMRKWRAEHPEYQEKQKKACKEWLEKHPDYIYGYNKKWRQAHPGRVLEANKTYRKNHPEKRNEQKQRYAGIHPDRNSARRKALRLNAEVCVQCGSKENIERHHPDYSQPLQIVPLCHDCHVNVHRKDSGILLKEA